MLSVPSYVDRRRGRRPRRPLCGLCARLPGPRPRGGRAEPRDFHREHLAREHAIPAVNVCRDWRELAARPKFADAVLICTQDAMHEEPAVAFAKLGYHILLEKPMAPTAAACRRIVKAAQRAGNIFAVCHVMRYTRYTQILKKLLGEGAIGEIVNVQQLEPVGFWHQAHSFVAESGATRRKAPSCCWPRAATTLTGSIIL